MIGYSACVLSGKILYKGYFKNISKQEHILYFLYEGSLLLIKRLPWSDKVFNNKKMHCLLQKLWINEELYWCKKITVVLGTVVLVNGFCILVQLGYHQPSILHKGHYILRPSYGQGEEVYDLGVGVTEGGIEKTQEVKITLEEQRYTEKAWRKAIKRAQKYLDEKVLGNNKNPDKITEDLNLINSIPKTSIKVTWETDGKGIVDSSGRINQESIGQKGQVVALRASMKCKERTAEYSMNVHIFPKIKTKEEKQKQEIQQVINNIVNKSLTLREISLPTKIHNQNVSYYEQSSSGAQALFFVGIILGIVIYFAIDRELESKLKRRNQELLLDYPEIITKFTLLLEAGLTIKNAWGRIVKEYKTKLEGGEQTKRFAYEEMMITWFQLGNGLSETLAFSKFGNRVGLLPYLRFSSMLSQNVKKGAKGLIELLEYEGKEAFESRKELARKQGEEASTKLLGPMMLMLMMVIFLIVIPAFMLI